MPNVEWEMENARRADPNHGLRTKPDFIPTLEQSLITSLGKSNHGTRRNRLRRTRKAIGHFRFARPSAPPSKSMRNGRMTSAESEGGFFKLLSVSREAGFERVRRWKTQMYPIFSGRESQSLIHSRVPRLSRNGIAWGQAHTIPEDYGTESFGTVSRKSSRGQSPTIPNLHGDKSPTIPNFVRTIISALRKPHGDRPRVGNEDFGLGALNFELVETRGGAATLDQAFRRGRNSRTRLRRMSRPTQARKPK